MFILVVVPKLQHKHQYAYFANADGSQVPGTACLTCSFRSRWDPSRLTVHNGIKTPSITSAFVVAESTCQQSVKLNIELKHPSGIAPGIPDFLLKYSAIWQHT